MDTIKDIWFDANAFYMKTDGGETFSRPLEAFPLLKMQVTESALISR